MGCKRTGQDLETERGDNLDMYCLTNFQAMCIWLFYIYTSILKYFNHTAHVMWDHEPAKQELNQYSVFERCSV